MKVIGLNNKEYNLKLSRKTKPSSSLHEKVRQILKAEHPMHLFYEEVRIPGSKLKLDFYVPEYNLMIEVQGRQHDEYVGHFHKNKFGFVSSLKRDKMKREWCELNNFKLLELRDGDWSEQIRTATC